MLINLYLNFKKFHEQRAKICGIINIHIFTRINHTQISPTFLLINFSDFLDYFFFQLSFSSNNQMPWLHFHFNILPSPLIIFFYPFTFLHYFHYLSSILLLSSFSFILLLSSILLSYPYFQFLTFLLSSYPTIFPILNLSSILLSYHMSNSYPSFYPLILPYFQFLTILLSSFPTIFPILILPCILLS